jgi:hypothetical protein
MHDFLIQFIRSLVLLVVSHIARSDVIFDLILWKGGHSEHMIKLCKCGVVIRYCSDKICHNKYYDRKTVSFFPIVNFQFEFKRQLFVTVV